VAKSLDRSLLDLTNAYLAVDALLKSELLSPETRRKLEKTKKLLDRESAKLIREYAEEEKRREQAA
jgi:hypothetical protein